MNPNHLLIILEHNNTYHKLYINYNIYIRLLFILFYFIFLLFHSYYLFIWILLRRNIYFNIIHYLCRKLIRLSSFLLHVFFILFLLLFFHVYFVLILILFLNMLNIIYFLEIIYFNYYYYLLSSISIENQ
jgi:hypothetical protein